MPTKPAKKKTSRKVPPSQIARQRTRSLATKITPRQIAQQRKALDLSQQAFSSLLGISFVTINRWERGHTAPEGLSLVLLQLLKSATAKRPADKVVARLRATGPDPLSLIRELIKLEG